MNPSIDKGTQRALLLDIIDLVLNDYGKFDTLSIVLSRGSGKKRAVQEVEQDGHTLTLVEFSSDSDRKRSRPSGASLPIPSEDSADEATHTVLAPER